MSAEWVAVSTKPRGEDRDAHLKRMEAKAAFLRGFAIQDAAVRVITYDAEASAEAVARAPKAPSQWSRGPHDVTCPTCGQTRTVQRLTPDVGPCQKCSRMASRPPSVRPCVKCGHATRPARWTVSQAPDARARFHGDHCSECWPRRAESAA